MKRLLLNVAVAVGITVLGVLIYLAATAYAVVTAR